MTATRRFRPGHIAIGATVPLLLLASLGCGSDPLGPEFGQRFTHFGGCADVVLFAVDARDELMITFRADGLVQEAQGTGVPTETVIDLPADDVVLIVEQGSSVSDATCDDVVMQGGPRVGRTWTATAGSATLRISPREGGGRADLVLEDVVFEADGEDEVTLERLEWQDVSVGWLPG
jgi:hypothetical protein